MFSFKNFKTYVKKKPPTSKEQIFKYRNIRKFNLLIKQKQFKISFAQFYSNTKFFFNNIIFKTLKL